MNISDRTSWQKFKAMDKAERLEYLRAALLCRVDETESDRDAAALARAYVEAEKLDQEGEGDIFNREASPTGNQVPLYKPICEEGESGID